MSAPRNCFLAYHRADAPAADRFVTEFDGVWRALIDRGIDASMAGAIVNSSNDAYIKTSIRETYLRATTVTIVLVGAHTWSRKFVDWEIAASLEHTATSPRSGLLAIRLPGAPADDAAILRTRLGDNIRGDDGYARLWPYPRTRAELAAMIEDAHRRRDTHAHLADNSRRLRERNAYVGGPPAGRLAARLAR